MHSNYMQASLGRTDDVSVGTSLRESKKNNLQDSRKQERKKETGREGREECDEGSGGGDCIACLEGESENFN